MFYRITPILFSTLTIITACSEKADDTISGTIAYTLGKDTTMVQEFELKGNELTQTWVHRTPEVQIITGKTILDENGNMLTLKAEYFKPDLNGERTLQFTNELNYKNDTTYITQGYRKDAEPRAIPGKVMTTNTMKPIGMFWHAQMAYFAPENVGEVKTNKHLVSRTPIDFRISRISKNEVTVGSNAMGTYRIFLDTSGKVTGVDGTASSFNIKGTVVDKIDIDALARRFLNYELDQGKWSSLTGKGETTGVINGTSVSIQYGRPFQRERKIFGGIVPWGKVWRTGANAATKMIIDGPLTLGGNELEAGEYSLWSIPHDNGNFDLIVNSEANTWGTNHDADADLYTIPMKVHPTDTLTEQFTITIQNNELTLAWADLYASVELR